MEALGSKRILLTGGAGFYWNAEPRLPVRTELRTSIIPATKHNDRPAPVNLSAGRERMRRDPMVRKQAANHAAAWPYRGPNKKLAFAPRPSFVTACSKP